MPDKNSKYAIFIIISGFLARLINIGQPLFDVTMWRQTDTAAIARNFYYNGMNIFYPQVLWGGATEGYVGETEFQLYTFVVALLYKIFGVHEYFGRLVSIFAFCGGAFFLYKLARRYIGAQGAIVALLFYTFNPHIFFYSRSFQPESTMLFFSIALVYFFSQWIDTERRKDFILMTLCGACAFLVKLPTACLGLPLLYLCIVKYRWKLFLEWKLWLFAFLTLLPAALWYIFSYKLNSLNGVSFHSYHVGTMFGSEYIASLDWYKTVFYVYIFERNLIYIGAVLTIVGFFSAIRNKDLYLFHFWILCLIIFFFVSPETTGHHSHWSMPITVPSSIFIAWTIVTYFHRIKNFRIKHLPALERYLIMPFFILSIILLPIICFHKIKAKYKPERLEKDMPIYIAGNKVREMSPKDALIITAHWGGPELLYYSDRRGWRMESRYCTIESIESFRESGATWFVSTRVMEINKNVISHLQNNYEVMELTDQYIIVKL
ncbi:MAG: ArnT family glycosyltransferase [Candidatus Scalinduaceae bacterium]